MQIRRFLLPGILLFTFAALHAQQPAADILKEATQQATKEKKNVILIFHASWCGWCHKMDTALNDPSCKKFFDDNYVITHITVQESAKHKDLENPGGDALMKQFNGEKQGLPYWVILDKKGTLLYDSQVRKEGAAPNSPGSNIGCPAQDDEIAYFISLLKKTSSLKDKQLAAIEERFKKINPARR
jgi:thiol-disulfide isomerase/thioredoxin